jgi:protein-S-isoprenylcysteine O-methyltransferase Ste14
MTRAGRWLFRWRTWLPLPLIAALLVVRPANGSPGTVFWLAGVAGVACGEALRLWSVRNIGVISRTRSDRLGPLVATGPFAFVRNPLYIGNILLWVGFAVSEQALVLAAATFIILALEYHAIVRWEEELLLERIGKPYRDYAARVPRWLPSLSRRGTDSQSHPFSWRDTFFSERGTLLAIAIGYATLYVKFKLKI